MHVNTIKAGSQYGTGAMSITGKSIFYQSICIPDVKFSDNLTGWTLVTNASDETLEKKLSLFQCRCDATLARALTYCEPKRNSLTQFLLPCCYDWQKMSFITSSASPGVLTRNSLLTEVFLNFTQYVEHLHHTWCTDYTHYIDYTDHCIIIEHFHHQVFVL